MFEIFHNKVLKVNNGQRSRQWKERSQEDERHCRGGLKASWKLLGCRGQFSKANVENDISVAVPLMK